MRMRPILCWTLMAWSAAAPASGALRPDLCQGEHFRAHPVAAVDYLGFFASGAQADAAAREIDAQKFAVELREAAVGEGLWSLKATYRSLPSAADFARDRAVMAALGKRHGADSFLPGCTSARHS